MKSWLVVSATLAAVALFCSDLVVASVSRATSSAKARRSRHRANVPNPLVTRAAALRAERTAAGRAEPITSEELARRGGAPSSAAALVEARYACGGVTRELRRRRDARRSCDRHDPRPNITSGKGGRVASYTNADGIASCATAQADGSPADAFRELFAMSTTSSPTSSRTCARARQSMPRFRRRRSDPWAKCCSRPASFRCLQTRSPITVALTSRTRLRRLTPRSSARTSPRPA